MTSHRGGPSRATGADSAAPARSLVITVYRCAMAGFSVGQTDCWRIGWQALSEATPSEEAGPLFGQFYCFVRALSAVARKPLSWRAPGSLGLCDDEALSLRMIEAAQHADMGGMLAAGATLLGVDKLGDVVEATQSLAKSLTQRGLFVGSRRQKPDDPRLRQPRQLRLTDSALRDTRFVRNKLVAAGMRSTRQRLDVGRLIFQSGDSRSALQ